VVVNIPETCFNGKTSNGEHLMTLIDESKEFYCQSNNNPDPFKSSLQNILQVQYNVIILRIGGNFPGLDCVVFEKYDASIHNE